LDCGLHWGQKARQHVTALAGCEARREETVVELSYCQMLWIAA
jgi:hypothetical protein